MSIDERSRHELYAKLEHTLGQKEADTLMAHLPPTTFSEVATKADLEQLRTATKADLEQLRMATKADLAQLEARMDTNLHAALAQQTWRLVGTMLTLVVAVLAVGQIG